MTTPDWTQFRRLIYIRASVETLYRMWATRKGMETFFLEYAPYSTAGGVIRGDAELCKSGDSYRWRWHNWDGEHQGKVLECNGKDRLLLEFEGCNLEIRFYEGRGMTCVDLHQYDIPTDDYSKYFFFFGTGCGWTFWLANLKAVAEYGISLNDTEPGLLDEHRDTEVVNI